MKEKLRRAAWRLRDPWTWSELLHHTLPRWIQPSHQHESLHCESPVPADQLSKEYPTAAPRRVLTALHPSSQTQNPVLVAGDVTDYGRVNYVADPFLHIPEVGDWHVFFEVFNHARDPTGVIGHAVSHNHGQTWNYNQVVLETDSHLSFPFVFSHRGEYYMLPERSGSHSPTEILLYEARDFPTEWYRSQRLVNPDKQLTDRIIFQWNERWWLLAGEPTEDALYVYLSPTLHTSNWIPHPENPVVRNRPTASRPAGRPIVTTDAPVVFFQDTAAQYGDKVRAFELSTLSSTAYEDIERVESPILEGTSGQIGWNTGRMHHIDPWFIDDQWYCAVDGNVRFGHSYSADHWAIGIYSSSP